jgi:amino acid adenylation domain-containing protein
VALSFESVFATPTVAGLARRIAASGEAAPVWETLPVRPVPREGSLPLSYPQHRLWFLEQLALNPPAYNIMDAVHLSGRLNAAALAQSLQDITSRHEVLRTTFVNVEGEPRQVVGPCTPVPVSVVDLQDVAAPAQAARVEALAIQEAHGRFDHARAPLIRVTLVRLAPEEQVLLLAMPQLVCDGWSHGVFWRDLAALYEARCAEQTARLADLPVQYADFAYWQRDWMHGHALDAQLAYWTRQLAGAARLQLRSDYPRPTTRTSRGAKSRLSLPLHLAERLRAISQKHDVTLFMTLLAAFQAVLHRYTGQDDILIGSLVAGRNRPEFEGMLGFFTNTVALRTDLSGDPRFDELLNRVRAVMLGAFSHQDVPFEKLLEAQALPRDPGGSPLLQVLFVLQNVPSHAPHLPGLASRVLPIDVGTARFEMALELAEAPDGIHGWLEYNTDLFAASTVDRLGEHLQTVLRSIAGNPAQRLSTLPLWTAEEHRRLLESWSTGRSAHRADVCLHQMFEAQTARTPQATAVICEEARITYGELNGRANQLAHYLRERGAGPGTLVGLCMERSIDMVVALLGILKAGAAYVPLDPTYPKERLAFMLADAEVVAIVTKQALAASLPRRGAPFVWLDADERTIAQHSEKNGKSGVTADDIAYLLYTSGSTGAPKGVLGVHRATLNALTWMWETYPFAADEVCCQKTSLNFGDSILELFGPLLSGTSTVLIPDTVLKDLRRFVGTLAERRVTRIVLVPSLLRALLDTQPDLARQLPHLALWFCSGEILLTDVWRRFCARMPHRRLVNFYGASEMSDDVTWYEPDGTPLAGISVPIGRPIPNVQVYVLDPHLQPVPIAVQGELHVAGACLTRGYLKRPDLTAERFIPNPFSDEPGARLYKTGDRARFLADGNLEFLGRVDEQVKLRGYRIEPREIELALEQHSSIRQAVVIAREEVTGDLRLVAYLVINGEVAPPLGALRRFLRERLPDHMVPSALVTLDRLPLTPSGKIDRRALPAPDRHRPALDEGFVAPRTATEALLARIWAQLLVVEQVGAHDSFFELGGHSLLAMQLLSRIHAATRVDVPLLKFFETPTVAHMAEWIDAARPTGRGRAPIPPVPRGRRLSASVAQEHLWLLEQAEPHPPSPNISHVWRLTGPLVVAVLDRSVDALIRRHESLRTTFRLVDGRLELAIASAMRVPVVLVDLRGLSSPDAREAEGRRLAQAEARQPFDLSREPLVRLRLWRVDEEEHLFLVTMHHIVSDGWSLGIFIRELAAVYAAYADDRPVLLAPLSIQYAEFAHWQRQWLHDASLRDQLAYWKLQLRGPLRTRELPTDRPRRYGLIARTTRETFALPRALFEELAALSQRADGTLFMAVLAGFEILLHGYTGEEDMRVATFVANRHRHETEGVIGLFADMVILRTDLGGDPGVREVLRRVRAATLEAYTHADFPFEELVRILERERGLVRASLSRVMVIWQNAALFQSQLAAPPVTFVDIDQRGLSPEATLTTFDIILELREHPDGLTGSCLYDANLFDAGTVRRLLDDFRGVLELMVARPDQPLANFRQSRRPGPDGAAQ